MTPMTKSSGPSSELLESIDQSLHVLVALTTRLVQVLDPSLSDPKHPSLDSLLTEAGLSQAQVALVLGKDASSVSRQLSRDQEKLGSKGKA